MKHLPTVLLALLLSIGLQAQEFTTYTYKDSLQLDVFTPPGLKPGDKRPVMVLFHGGGWTKGTRPVMYPECRYFVKRGFITVTASYRLLQAGETDKSICIMDAKSAIRWVLAHARELHADPNTLVLGGSSAGGHLATMAALDQQTETPIRPKALLLLNPAYRLSDPPAVLPFDNLPKTFPPAIQFFGDQDISWKPGGDKFRALLDSTGIRNEYWIAKDEAHTFYRKPEWAEHTMVKMDAFLVGLGIIKGPAPTVPGPEKYSR